MTGNCMPKLNPFKILDGEDTIGEIFIFLKKYQIWVAGKIKIGEKKRNRLLRVRIRIIS